MVTKVAKEATAEAAGTKAKEEKAPAQVTKTFFKLARKLTEEDKLPKQAAQIIGVLDTHGVGKEMERDDLLVEMKKVIETKQPIERILSFYQSRLKSSGLIDYRNETTKVEKKAA